MLADIKYGSINGRGHEKICTRNSTFALLNYPVIRFVIDHAARRDLISTDLCGIRVEVLERIDEQRRTRDIFIVDRRWNRKDPLAINETADGRTNASR